MRQIMMRGSLLEGGLGSNHKRRCSDVTGSASLAKGRTGHYRAPDRSSGETRRRRAHRTKGNKTSGRRDPMYPTKNDLPEGTRSKIVDLCNARLADAIDLQTQCK